MTIAAGIAALLSSPSYGQSVVSYGSGSIASSVPSVMSGNDAYYAPTPANMETFYSTLNIDPSLKNKAIPSNKWWTWLATAYSKDANGNWFQGSPYGCQLWAYPGMVEPQTYGMDVYFPNSWQARTSANSPNGNFDTGPAVQVVGNVSPTVGSGDVLIADFDETSYPSGWTVTGNAFGSGPVQGGSWSGEAPPVTGFIGNACVNSYTGSDAATGTLTSPTFTISDTYIDLLVSGGNDATNEVVQLIVGGNVVATATGQNSNTMAWTQWNVSAYKGQSVQIKIVDSSTGGWGHIAVSWIVQTNTATNPPTQYTSTFTASGNPIVTNYGDWTLDYKETDAKGNEIDTTLARGVPFVWARYTGVQPTIANLPAGYTLYDVNGNAINTSSGSFTATSFAFDDNGRTFGVFAPTNTTFKIIGSGIQAQLPSPSFLVYGFLPDHTYLNTFSQYAYARPTGSTFGWTYDIPNGQVKTTWTLTTAVLQGTGTSTLQGWLPHHYRTTSNNLALQSYTYLTPRGTMKIAPGTSFQINFPFRGIAPVLPAPHVNGLANDYNASRLYGFVNNFAPYHPGTFDETYGGGKELAISAQYMTMADQLGMSTQAATIKNTMESRLDDWLSYTSGKSQHFFARYPDWGALVGYGASYGTQGFNDNHFHYGYWTISSALLGMEDHTWLNNYAPMMTQVLKEYANWDRSDTSYPFLRTFDVWEGHSWAGGTSSPNGENQESSSEAMNSWVGMFMFGSMTGNSAIQAAGAMGYSIESSAVNEYWQDMYQTNFPASYGMGMNGILGSGGLAYGTFFTADPAWIYGIQMVPTNHWNDYLVRNKTFAANQLSKMWSERASGVNGFTYTGTNDVSGLGGYLGNYILGYQLMFDPDTVASTLDTYYANNDPIATDSTYAGEIYYLTHALRGLGDQDLNYWTSIPTSQVYYNSRTGVRTAVIYNPSSTGQTATIYNNGTAVMSITVPAYQVVSQVVAPTNVAPAAPTDLTALAGKAQVSLYWAPSSGATSYNVYMGTSANGENGTPIATGVARTSYVFTGLTNGTTYYFKVAAINGAGTSPMSTEVSATPNAPFTGPYGGTPWAVPGTIEAENFDVGGQGVAYNDSDSGNDGGQYRTSDAVDIEATSDTTGAYDVGWTVAGEWMNYTINAANAGTYTVTFRVAAPNAGCAIHLQDASGNNLTGAVNIPATGAYQTWENVTAPLSLPAGQQTLTLYEDTGGFNINYMTFTYTGGPAAPTGLTATAGNSQVSLSWTGSSGATSYNVYRGTTGGGEGTTAIAAGLTGTTYTNTGLTNGTTYYYKVAAVNSSGASALSNEGSATPAGSSEAPYGGTPAAIPGTVQAENYDTGGEGVAYHDSDAVNSGGQYRTDGVDIEATTDTGGGYDVGWTNAGEYLKYTVNVASAGTYTVGFRVAAPSAVTGAFHLLNQSGANITGAVNVPATGGWQTWTTVNVNVTLAAGQQVLELYEDAAGYNLNFMSFTAQSNPVYIDAGGAASGSWVADIDFSGGTAVNPGNTIDTSLLTGTIPPQAVLQSNRYGTCTYTIPGFTAGSSHTVTLYFAEEYWTASGKRVFNVTANGTTVLSNFDIYAAAGAANKAVQRSFTTTANSSGQIVITFTSVTDNAQVNGIAVN
jgi:endoglucanase Acf2/fibronectin type 3 domain-containing protein